MRLYIIFFLLIIINGCSNINKTFWCGDHPCINNKEKEAYFKKNQVVEKKVFGKKEKYVPDEEIIKKAVITEKIPGLNLSLYPSEIDNREGAIKLLNDAINLIEKKD